MTMTLRTLTFNPAQRKLMPADATKEMVAKALKVDWANDDVEGAIHNMWNVMYAAVPDTLPGVVEHSGEPFGYFHELLGYKGKGTGVWLGCPDREATEKAYVEGETSKEVVALFTHPAPAQQVERQELSAAATDVLVERQRQIEKEGRLPYGDDCYVNDEIAAYATFYAMPPAARDWPATETGYGETWGKAIIPADWTAPKSGDRRRELVKAGALILAEIERLDRAKDRGQA